MVYKPVQNESAHLTDKPGRPAPHVKKAAKGKRESKSMKKPMPLEKSRPNKTRS